MRENGFEEGARAGLRDRVGSPPVGCDGSFIGNQTNSWSDIPDSWAGLGLRVRVQRRRAAGVLQVQGFC